MSRSITIIAGMLFSAVIAAPQIASAGHFTHQHRLEDDISTLHHAAERLHDLVHYRHGFSHLERETCMLAEAAEHFCRTARRGGSLGHLRADFQDVLREFRHVQDELRAACRHRHSYTVERAWVDVERALDRVYFDLYESHCRHVRYQCSVPVVRQHHGSQFNIHYSNRSSGHYNHYNSHRVQYRSSAPAWLHILNAALQ